MTKRLNFQKQTVRDLSLWVSGEKHDPELFIYRRANAGKEGSKGGVGAQGNLYSDKPDGKLALCSLTFEIKYFTEIPYFDLWNLLTNTPCEVSRAFNEAKDRTQFAQPVLVFKCGNKPALVLSPCICLFPTSESSTVLIGETRCSLFSLDSLLDKRYDPKRFAAIRKEEWL